MTDITVIQQGDVALNLEEETRRILDEVSKTKNFEAGFSYINELHDQGRKFAGMIGIMIEGMEREWKPEEHEGETFLQAAVRYTELHPTTIKRHSKIQRFLESNVVPENVRDKIKDAGQKSLVRIANMVDRVEVSQANWKKIAEVAYDEKSLGVVLRKIEKVEPRSNWLSITMDERGRLFENTKRGRKQIGILYVNDDDPDVKKAIERITGCAGILDSVEY